VGRYFDFMERHLQRKCGYELTAETRRELEGAVLRLEVMPSMRALMTAGPALERDNVCAYNCSYLPVSSPRAFDECLYILMVCFPLPSSPCAFIATPHKSPPRASCENPNSTSTSPHRRSTSV
jgi:hypothetical protein